MQKLVFKTNVKCNGCRAAITPYLDSEPSISGWKVDIFDKDRLLTVEGEALDAGQVISLLKEAGYQAELFQQ
ncbi:MAG: heavy-metal-associated domain-containing protein [Bacteroidetes bacterium]|nr:heavy-metal-associated domain-containing protein [Bacteroidota bacterium]